MIDPFGIEIVLEIVASAILILSSLALVKFISKIGFIFVSVDDIGFLNTDSTDLTLKSLSATDILGNLLTVLLEVSLTEVVEKLELLEEIDSL